ncbi:MAG: CotH kinase family protein [Bacteroidetes bacterium]|nr:CotH kinase family protein [Bacteroidota bacterium]
MKKIYSFSKILFFVLIGLSFTNIKAQILINEYSCANLSNIQDNNQKYEDWIELYNTTGSPINLTGYFLSDDVFNLAKFPIPAGATINANSVYIIWASGRGTITAGNVHANFKLTQTKDNAEPIILSNPSNVVIDSLRVLKTKLGQSRGRATNGAATWGIFTNPTPNANNAGSLYSGFADRPSMTYTAGLYTSAISVALVNNEPTSNAMYYTIDGTEPTTLSTLYTGAISVSTTQIIKAIATSTNPLLLSSFVDYNTYLINEVHTVPIISISGTSLTTLANGSQSLKPNGSIEYFTPGGIRTSKSYGGFNSHGQDSWANSHRSLDFVARDEMGYSAALKEHVFSQTTRDKFQHLILRAAGDDNYPADFHTANAGSAHLRDAYFQTLCKDGGMKLDIRTGSKCVVYLNGKYWGVYDLREIPDDHDYTEYNYNQGKYDLQYILTWGSTWAEYGGSQALADWNTLKTYIFNNSMAVQSNFDYVASQLDVESLADYVIGHSMSVSSDWLNYNTGWWRGLNPAGGHKKWGYILWDNDASFDFYINYTNVPSTSYTAAVCNVDNLYNQSSSDPQKHTKILKTLRNNPGFNQWYISRYADLMNTTFSCQHMLDYLDSTKAVIDPEMTRQTQRWGGTYAGWQTNFDTLRAFIAKRCGTNPNNGMNGCYNLTGPYPVTFSVNPTGAANVTVNSLTVTQLPWAASYYGNIDVNLSSTSYSSASQFVTWTSNVNPYLIAQTTNVNKIKLTHSDTLVANYILDVGIKTLENPFSTDAKVFPNPTNGGFSIEFDVNETSPVNIKMFSTEGKQVAELVPNKSDFAVGSYKIDIDQTIASTLSNGIYFIQLSVKNYNKTFKLVVQK